jgi:hypothetical protein
LSFTREDHAWTKDGAVIERDRNGSHLGAQWLLTMPDGRTSRYRTLHAAIFAHAGMSTRQPAVERARPKLKMPNAEQMFAALTNISRHMDKMTKEMDGDEHGIGSRLPDDNDYNGLYNYLVEQLKACGLVE